MTLMDFKLGKTGNGQKMMEKSLQAYPILFSFHVYSIGILLYKAFNSLQTALFTFFYTQQGQEFQLHIFGLPAQTSGREKGLRISIQMDKTMDVK